MYKVTDTKNQISLYLDEATDVQLVEYTTTEYSLVAITLDNVILRSVKSTDSMVVWDHKAKEIGKFSVGSLEAV